MIKNSPIWCDDWSHSPFIRRSPSWDFLGFSSAGRKMPWDLPRIISLSPLSLATDVTDATLGTTGLWVGTRAGATCIATLAKSFFGRSPWLHGQEVIFERKIIRTICGPTRENGICHMWRNIQLLVYGTYKEMNVIDQIKFRREMGRGCAKDGPETDTKEDIR